MNGAKGRGRASGASSDRQQYNNVHNGRVQHDIVKTMKQCMQNRIRHSVRSLSCVHQLSQIGAYNMKFTPKF